MLKAGGKGEEGFGFKELHGFRLVGKRKFRLVGLPRWLSGKESARNARDTGDTGLTPGSGRSPGEGQDNPLQHSLWRIPWTEKPGGLQSLALQRVGHD